MTCMTQNSCFLKACQLPHKRRKTIMSNYEDDFFEAKRPWSLIKDKVLACYIEPYINKVKQLSRQIILIDGYAGPGVFDDRGEGSPITICSAAEKFAKGRYTAYFFNNNKKHHEKLQAAIKHAGWSNSAYERA